MAGTSFRQIEQDMRAKIRYGKWTPGALLPSRRDLAKEYGVTCVTVQRAIASLLSDGTVRAHPRKGTFVSGEAAPVRAFGHFDNRYAMDTPGKKLTLGIVAELPAQGSPRSDGNYFEQRVAVQAVEQVYSEQALTTRFMNIVQPDGKHLLVDEAIDALLAEHIDGIVVVFSDEPDKVNRVFSMARKIKVPIVYIASRELAAPLPHIYFDNRDAGFQAAQHLLDQGCMSLAFVAPFLEDWGQEREAGIRHAVSAAGLREQSLRVQPDCPEIAPWNSTEPDMEYETNKQIVQAAAYESGKALFGSGECPDGIIAVNDHAAFGVIQAAAECDRLPGRDFLIIGFDDVPDSRIVNLSTLRPPLEWMGHEAANLLLDAVSGRQLPQQVKLRSHLVTRASTSKPARPTPAGERAESPNRHHGDAVRA
ncbi:MAG: GntR family transcriptional regulator [Capsulimonadaceae bacterium]|nr:GntR family transcriptional regulator [Capsulimonadaceae bacterium]